MASRGQASPDLSPSAWLQRGSTPRSRARQRHQLPQMTARRHKVPLLPLQTCFAQMLCLELLMLQVSKASMQAPLLCV